MQLNRWLHLSGKSLGNSVLEKSGVIATNNWTVLAFWWFVQLFLLQIPHYSRKLEEKKKKKKDNHEAFSFSRKRKKYRAQYSSAE